MSVVSQLETASVSVSAGVAGEVVTITLTLPDGSTTTITETTVADPSSGAISATTTYTALQAGTYTGVATIPSESGFGAATSASATFSVLTPRTISLSFSP